MPYPRKRFKKKIYLLILRTQKFICACGCGEKLKKGEIDFDHHLPLHLGGKDTVDNLRAVRKECHKEKTTKESKVRAKIRRIKSSNGLKKRRLNKKEKLLSHLKDRDQLP